MREHARLPRDGLDLWLAGRPRGFTDLRKLVAAVLLMRPFPD